MSASFDNCPTSVDPGTTVTLTGTTSDPAGFSVDASAFGQGVTFKVDLDGNDFTIKVDIPSAPDPCPEEPVMVVDVSSAGGDARCTAAINCP